MSEDDWFYDAVKTVYEKDLFKGTADDKFSPSIPMTRAMFVQVFANLEKADTSGYDQSAFTDVSSSMWYSKPIAWAFDVGLASGVGNQRFEPDRAITREEMAVMLNNYIEWKGVELNSETKEPFVDFDQVSSWAKEAVTAIQGYGIISGVGNNIYAPKSTAERSQVAQIFANYIGKLSD